MCSVCGHRLLALLWLPDSPERTTCQQHAGEDGLWSKQRRKGADDHAAAAARDVATPQLSLSSDNETGSTGCLRILKGAPRVIPVAHTRWPPSYDLRLRLASTTTFA